MLMAASFWIGRKFLRIDSTVIHEDKPWRYFLLFPRLKCLLRVVCWMNFTDKIILGTLDETLQKKVKNHNIAFSELYLHQVLGHPHPWMTPGVQPHDFKVRDLTFHPYTPSTYPGSRPKTSSLHRGLLR